MSTIHCRPHVANAPFKRESKLRPGDVCVNSTGTGTIGRIGLWSGDSGDAAYFADTHVTIVRPIQERIDSKFLTETLLSHEVQRFLETECFSGSTNQIELSRSAFAALQLLIPPRSEQKKIAAILSSVDEAIEATQAVVEQLQVVKKAMMGELLTKGIPGRHSRFKKTEIGEVPEGWGVVRLGELLDGIDAGWSPKCESRPAREEEWGVLKVSAVSWGEFRPDENKALPSELTPRVEAEVNVGDLLVSRANTPELVGRCVLVRSTRPRLMLSDKLLRLQANLNLASPAFLREVLDAPFARQQIQDAATGSSRSMKNISQEKLRMILVPKPSFDEQVTIANAFEAIGERMQLEMKKVEALCALKSALLSVLLTGEVRVRVEEEEARCGA